MTTPNGRYQDGYGEGHGHSYGQESYPQDGYGQPGYSQQGYQNYEQGYGQGYGQGYEQSYEQNQPKLLAGRFEGKKVAVNLVIFAILAAVVTFAAVFIVDLLVGMIPNENSSGIGVAIMTGAIAGVIGVLAGLLYIPVSGTGNESLFRWVVIALAIVAIVMWVILGGLLEGNWHTLVTLTGILCTAAIASVTPSRIESAAVA